MNRSFTLVSGALKNVGDFLISEKCHEMVNLFLRPNENLILKRNSDLSRHLEEINRTDAIFICGGPGYSIGFYDEVYPFLHHHREIKVPIIPLGLGWRGFPLYHPERFRFSEMSKRAIRRIHEQIACSSTRDELTRGILMRTGVNNVLNTGCPSLFNMTLMDDDTRFRVPSRVSRVAVSMAQQPILHRQNLQLLERLKNDFPSASISAVFHRGTGTDKYTTPNEGARLQKLVTALKRRGFEVVDLAYNLNQIGVYDNVDFHVGYRVHAHAYSVSKRVPTFLLWEDGRGQGMSETLHLQGIPARNEAMVDRLRGFPAMKTIMEKGVRRVFGEPGPSPDAIDRITKLIHSQIDSGFDMFSETPERLNQLFSNLQQFFKSNEELLYS